MTDLPGRLRADLTAAMRAKDRDAARVLRTVLSAIANAEAQPATNEPLSLRTEGPIAGATQGLGSGEVDRRQLGEDDLRSIVDKERAERLQSADVLAASGAVDAAEALRSDAAFLERYLS